MVSFTALLLLALMLPQVFGNIIFDWIQPTCNNSLPLGQQGCLRGQYCHEDGTCEQNWGPGTHDKLKVTFVTAVADGASRNDGRCGSAFDNASCDLKGEFGGCCSGGGWCGKTEDHCLASNGCESGCASDPEPTTSSPTNPASIPLETEPVIPPPKQTGAVTTNGQCGASNNGDICGNWHLGSCCSMYGFCGDSASHCNEGCQSGPCRQAPVPVSPGPIVAPWNANPGSFKVVGRSGVPAMHAALLPNGRVVFLDKVENYTEVKLSDGRYAYSAEYDPATNDAVPLAYSTNAFCAGGTFLANGTLLSIGGNANLSWLDLNVADGWRGLRYLTRSSSTPDLNGQQWIEPGQQLDTARWYPYVQTMPDGTVFVASGSLNGLDPSINTNNNPTYEILSRDGIPQIPSTTLPLLVRAQPYYMYPFIHLLPTGDLFIFASKSSELFSLSGAKTTKTLPDLPGDYRTYPNTSGTALLPLSSANNWAPSIIICGEGAYQDIMSPTDASCGRINPLDDNPMWELDAMPEGRGMVEATLLPDCTVLWLNGANSGAQGFGLAKNPTFEALIYDPKASLGARWTRGASSTISRLYHSVALPLLDGTVMIAGSNPVQMPVLEADAANPYPTEFRVEIYTPPYLSSLDAAAHRPTDIMLSNTNLAVDGQLNITFTTPDRAKNLQVLLYHGGFVTHSLHIGARMLYLDTEGFQPGQTGQRVTVSMPGKSGLTPPGPYVVYVVVDGVPGLGQFVVIE